MILIKFNHRDPQNSLMKSKPGKRCSVPGKRFKKIGVTHRGNSGNLGFPEDTLAWFFREHLQLPLAFSHNEMGVSCTFRPSNDLLPFSNIIEELVPGCWRKKNHPRLRDLAWEIYGFSESFPEIDQRFPPNSLLVQRRSSFRSWVLCGVPLVKCVSHTDQDLICPGMSVQKSLRVKIVTTSNLRSPWKHWIVG